MKIQHFSIFACLVTRILSNTYFNKTDSSEVCQGYGGLFSEQHFIERNGVYNFEEDKYTIDWNISDGESVWINGYIEYANVTTIFVGCYILSPTLDRIPVEQASVYTCSKICGEIYLAHDFIYMGMNNHDCICFTESKMIELKSAKVCDIALPYHLRYMHSNDTNNHIFFAVYRVLHYYRRLSYQQCETTRKNKSARVITSASCYNMNAFGFICSSVDYEKGDPYCSLIFGPSRVCISHNLSTTWLQAQSQCFNRSGYLFDYALFKLEYDFMKSRLKTLEQYWIGGFRSFRITSTYPVESNFLTACLAATRLGEKLVIDPDDCAKTKRVLCAHGLYDVLVINNTISTIITSTVELTDSYKNYTKTTWPTDNYGALDINKSSSTYLNDENVTSYINITPTTNLEDNNEQIRTRNGFVYYHQFVTAGLLIVLLLIALISTVCCVYWKRKFKGRVLVNAYPPANDHEIFSNENYSGIYDNLYATVTNAETTEYESFNQINYISPIFSRAEDSTNYPFNEEAFNMDRPTPDYLTPVE